MRTLSAGPLASAAAHLPADIKAAMDKGFTTPFLRIAYCCQNLGIECSHFSLLTYLVGRHGLTETQANALSLPTVAEILAQEVAQKQERLSAAPETIRNFVALLEAAAHVSVDAPTRTEVADQRAPAIESSERGEASPTGAVEPIVSEQPTKKSARKRHRKIVVDLGASSVTIDGRRFDVSPHHAQMLNKLVDAKGQHVTGPTMQTLPGCHGKNIYREILSLKKLVPPLGTLIKSDRNRGYFLIR